MKHIVLVLVAVLAPATSAAQDSAAATRTRIPLAAVDSNAAVRLRLSGRPAGWWWKAYYLSARTDSLFISPDEGGIDQRVHALSLGDVERLQVRYFDHKLGLAIGAGVGLVATLLPSGTGHRLRPGILVGLGAFAYGLRGVDRWRDAALPAR
jgi:hypothetical protein